MVTTWGWEPEGEQLAPLERDSVVISRPASSRRGGLDAATAPVALGSVSFRQCVLAPPPWRTCVSAAVHRSEALEAFWPRQVS